MGEKVRTVEGLLGLLTAQGHDAKTVERIHFAYDFAAKAHGEQKRADGTPYITHPLAAAYNLAEMHLPPDIVIAGLLHDVPEDTEVTLEDIEMEFGAEVSKMVGGITKLGKIKYRGMERYIENLRKMFLAMAEDVRVIIIKFADRLHNLETLDAIAPKKQYRIALESLEIYAPIANRLGMGEMKGRLEDLSFKYVLPAEYKWTEETMLGAVDRRESFIKDLIAETNSDLEKFALKPIDVHGRRKHLYSLYKKLLKSDRDVSRIYDLIALRIIVPTVSDCYAALGIIHSRWSPLKGRIKDYIAQPKPNGYRSLHTTVFAKDGQIVEFQIRTQEMHEASEYGIAAHWSYDEKQGKTGLSGKEASPRIDWIQQLAEIQQEVSDKKQYLKALEEVKIDIFRDRIFVFTPQGDVIDLPEDSTPVDFAYAIHTDLGNTCTAAKVNEEMVSLDRQLKSGDVIEIIIDKGRKGPNADWLKTAKTQHARARIRQFSKSGLSSWISRLGKK